MAGNLISSTVLRKQSIYRYVNADGAIANCLNMAIAGSVFRVVCDICGQGFKGKKQAYKHLETHADVVMVKKTGELDHFNGGAIANINNMVGASIGAASESGRGDIGGAVPAVIADIQSYDAEEEGVKDNGSDRIEVNVDHTHDIEMNESEEGGWRVEECEGQISDCSGLEEDVDGDATDVEMDPPLISAETITERASTIAYTLASTLTDETVNEEMLRSGIASTFEELRGREDEGNRGEGEASGNYGIDFQEECLANMCRAADLAGIGQLENQLDESEFDIEEVAQELSKPVDPGNPRSISIGQYCIDQLMIMEAS
jgi:hypothetical protein